MAASLNKVFLMGNLTREPELRYTPGSNAAVCEFGLAVNRRYTQNGQERDETCFLDIVVWGKQGESCSRFLQKGMPVLIEGRLSYEQWTEKDSQKKRSRIRVVADRVQFLGSGRRDEGNGSDIGFDDEQGGSYDQRPQSYSRPAPQQGSGPRQGGYSRQQYGAPQQRPQAPRQEQPGNGEYYQSPRPQQSMQDPAPMDAGSDTLADIDDIPF